MEEILKIKTNTEEIENNRRTLEERQKRERGNKIQNEVIQSHKKNVEIDWNWQELEEKEDCKELADVSFYLICAYFSQRRYVLTNICLIGH